jgi:hypothetical protein
VGDNDLTDGGEVKAGAAAARRSTSRTSTGADRISSRLVLGERQVLQMRNHPPQESVSSWSTSKAGPPGCRSQAAKRLECTGGW